MLTFRTYWLFGCKRIIALILGALVLADCIGKIVSIILFKDVVGWFPDMKVAIELWAIPLYITSIHSGCAWHWRLESKKNYKVEVISLTIHSMCSVKKFLIYLLGELAFGKPSTEQNFVIMFTANVISVVFFVVTTTYLGKNPIVDIWSDTSRLSCTWLVVIYSYWIDL